MNRRSRTRFAWNLWTIVILPSVAFVVFDRSALCQDDTEDAASEAEMKEFVQTIRGTKVSFTMVPIPGGLYSMGSPSSEPGRSDDEGPQHEVQIEPFWMGKTEVTWDEYELWGDLSHFDTPKTSSSSDPGHIAVDAITRPTSPYMDLTFGMGRQGYPAICVSQHAAKTYCEWLSKKTGNYYRLPTEAEWEYACRAGSTTAYHFGDDPDQLSEYGWFDKNSVEAGNLKYHSVGLKKPNRWGLHDMHGNVAEWVQDRYDPEFYREFESPKASRSPLRIAINEFPRVTRGGAWTLPASECRSASRMASRPEWNEQDPHNPKSAWYIVDAPFVGFRVIRPLRIPTPQQRKSQRLDAIPPKGVKPRGAILN